MATPEPASVTAPQPSAGTSAWRSLQGVRRRVVYLTLYEGIAIALATLGLAGLSDSGMAHAGVLATLSSVIAVLWNLGFNTLFEAWEARQPQRHRSLLRRVGHACGFEFGLATILVPLFAWWLGVTLWQALVMDAALLVFFLLYTMGFNWAFDRVFGLPAAVSQGAPAPRGSAR